MIRKSLLTAGAALAIAMVALSGCGGSDTKETTTAVETEAGETAETEAAEETRSEEELTDEASLTLGEYKGLTLTATRPEISDEEVEERMSFLIEAYPPTVEGRPAEMGDIANIDYAGYKDGEAFAGGTANGHDLELGSGQFIPGFEEGVVGMEIGEQRDIPLTFPEEYHSEDLAGQEVVFKVTLNSIKDIKASKLDDSLAKRVLEDDNATLDDLRAHTREEMELASEQTFFINAGNEILMQVVENSEITCDPDMVDQSYEQYVEAYTMTAEMYGMELEDYLSAMYGMSLDDLRKGVEEIVKQDMVIREIVAVENLEATDKQKADYAVFNGFETPEDLVAAFGEETAKLVFDQCAAKYFLIDNAITE